MPWPGFAAAQGGERPGGAQLQGGPHAKGLANAPGRDNAAIMQTLSEIEQGAMKLPENSRASLAWRLLASLPAVLSEEDDGVAEALRRSAEMDQDPGARMTLEELRHAVKR